MWGYVSPYKIDYFGDIRYPQGYVYYPPGIGCGGVLAKYGRYTGSYSIGYPNRVLYPYPYVTSVYHNPCSSVYGGPLYDSYYL